MLDLTVTLAHIFVVVGAIASGGLWAVNLHRDVQELKTSMAEIKALLGSRSPVLPEDWR